MAQYDSAGFEVGNTLAKLTYPAARLKRPGPPPAGQAPDFDPNALRGSPIRARNTAFALQRTGGRVLLALGPFVGPGLVKSISFTHTNVADGNPMPHWNIFSNTAPYASSAGLAVTDLPAGTPLIDARAARQDGAVFADEGGLPNVGQTVNGAVFMLNAYVPDATFYLALVIRNQTGGAGNIFGNLLVYEGVIPSDYPSILA